MMDDALQIHNYIRQSFDNFIHERNKSPDIVFISHEAMSLFLSLREQELFPSEIKNGVVKTIYGANIIVSNKINRNNEYVWAAKDDIESKNGDYSKFEDDYKNWKESVN